MNQTSSIDLTVNTPHELGILVARIELILGGQIRDTTSFTREEMSTIYAQI